VCATKATGQTQGKQAPLLPTSTLAAVHKVRTRFLVLHAEIVEPQNLTLILPTSIQATQLRADAPALLVGAGRLNWAGDLLCHEGGIEMLPFSATGLASANYEAWRHLPLPVGESGGRDHGRSQ
jgi:hypothetical protein